MPVKIRQAMFKDALAIAVFSRKSFYESFADQNTKENMEKFMLDFSVERLAEEVINKKNTFLLALENEEIIGYIKLSQSENPTELTDKQAVEISRIYIDKKMIGQGIGNILMKQGLDLAKNLGAAIVWLGVWEHNVNALSFYAKWGFERFSEHIFILGDDRQTDWLLKLELA